MSYNPMRCLCGYFPSTVCRPIGRMPGLIGKDPTAINTYRVECSTCGRHTLWNRDPDLAVMMWDTQIRSARNPSSE
jgi:hypothetical protein